MDFIDTQFQEEVIEMKKVFFGLGLTLIFNLAGVAQAQKNSTNSANKTVKQSASAQGSGSANASAGPAALSTVTNLQAVLQNSLDVKNAKVGDQVILKTTQAVKQAGQVVIPKGTQLIGRVTDVQKKAKNTAGSRLGLVFDRLQGRDLSVPIVASIVSITNLQAATNVGDDLSSDISGSSTTSARSSGGGSGGGGLLGGGSGGGGGLLGGVTNTVGGVVNSTTQTVGGVANTATNTLGSTTQAVGRTVNGLQISTSASGSAQTSTTLSSPNSNIRFDKGATFNLNVQKSGGN